MLSGGRTRNPWIRGRFAVVAFAPEGPVHLFAGLSQWF
jgi:hypothetical protein